MRILELSIKENVSDAFQVNETRTVRQDTRSFAGNWVVRLNGSDLAEREQRNLDWGWMLRTAVRRLHDALWVGVLESRHESLELLHYQTGPT